MKHITIKKTSVFPASEEAVYKRLQRLKTLQYIAYPYATFTPVSEKKNIIWKEGSVHLFRFRLFGCIPLGVHKIKVIRFDMKNGIFTREGNKFVPVWNHRIILESLDDNNTEYTDIVEIGAGWKTPFVALWAKLFYSHRQRKWISLLKKSE